MLRDSVNSLLMRGRWRWSLSHLPCGGCLQVLLWQNYRCRTEDSRDGPL